MNETFEREKLCYEQNCEQMRSLNQIMWQVPIIAMTLTGGLWYGVATLGAVQAGVRMALLLFGAAANIALILVIQRVRFVMAAMPSMHWQARCAASRPRSSSIARHSRS